MNYRPTSIIPVFAKILERLMYNRITSFLYENKILSEARNGFIKGKSIDTAVQSYVGESFENLKYFLSRNLLHTKGTQ